MPKVEGCLLLVDISLALQLNFTWHVVSSGSFPNEAVVRLAAEKLKAEGPVDPAQDREKIRLLDHFWDTY